MLSRLSTLIILFTPFVVLMLTLPVAAQYRGADRPRIVVVQRISFEYETSKIEAVGSAQASRSVTLFSSVSDEVTSVNFVPGQSVKLDEVLLELDSGLQDVNMQRAEIELEDAHKNLNRAKNRTFQRT